MYILNPTDEQLLEWFCCAEKLSNYLTTKCGLSAIHISNGKSYFVRTEMLNFYLDNLPPLQKFYKLFDF